MSNAHTLRMSLEEEYLEVYSLRKRFEFEIKKIIQDIIMAAGFEVTLISVRTKTPASFVAKANRTKKGKATRKYKKPLSEIFDITGVRVVVQYKDKAREIDKLLRSSLNVDEQNSRDTILEYEPSHFAYPAIHIVASLSDELSSKYDCQCIKNWKFEIQIRTIIEHAWAELSRNLFYNKDIPKEYERPLYALSATIERTDKEFIQLRNEVWNLHNNTAIDVVSSKDPIAVNDVIDLLTNSETIKELRRILAENGLSITESARNDYAGAIADIFRRQNAFTKNDAETLIHKNIAKLIDACTLYMKATNMSSFPTDSLLVAALAIVDNGNVQPADYCSGWTERWKNGFLEAARLYKEAH